MVNTTLQVLTSVFPSVFGVVFALAMKKIGKLQKNLEEIAPDLKPVLTPSQAAAVKSNATRGTIIGGIAGLTIFVILLLNTAAPSLMSWGRISVDPDTDLYTDLQIGGLVTLGIAWVVEIYCMRSFRVRADYLMNYYSNPKSARPPRSMEEEYYLLKRFPYNMWREPLAMSFHWMAISALLISQSWFLAIFMVLLVLLNEMMCIQNDVKWRSWFLKEAYDRYLDETGAQWSCGCLNGCNKAVLRMREEKFARLAAYDGDGAVTGTVHVSSSSDGDAKDVAIAVKRSDPYSR